MIKNYINKYWPLIFFLVFFILYSYPYLFLGKIPFPSSYIANELAPWNRYLSAGPVKNGIPDIGGEIYPMRSLVVDYLKNGLMPLWNPFIFSGTPFLANFQSAVFNPLNFLFFLIPKIDAWSILVLIQPFFAAVFLYLFMRRLNVSRVSSVFSATAFAFCGYMTVWGAYGTMAMSVLFLPLILYLVESYFLNKKLILLPLITIVLGISFFSGHIQSWMYVFLGTLIYLLVRQYQLKSGFKTQAVMLFFIFLSLPFVALQLFPALELYFSSSRQLAINDPQNTGIPVQYLITVLAPDFFGNPVTRNDWFGTYAEWMGYSGLVTLIFCLVAVTDAKNTKIRPFVALLMLGILLSVRSPILELISRLPLPVLSNSNPSRAVVLVSFAIAVLSGFGMDAIFLASRPKRKNLFYALGAVTVIVLSALFLSLSGNVFLSAEIAEKLKTVSFRNLLLPIFLTSACWILAVTYYFKNRLNKLIVLCFLLLVVIEMFRFYSKWMPFDERINFYPETGVTDFLKKQEGFYRFYGQFSQAPAYLEKLYGIEGYEPLNLLSYATFINAAISGKESKIYSLDVRLQSRERYTKKTLDMLGVKYLIFDAEGFKSPFVFPVWDYDYPKIYDDGKYFIFENKDVLPRAYLTGNVITEGDGSKVIARLFSESFNPKDSVIVENGDFNGISKAETANVKIELYEPNRIMIRTRNSIPQALVLGDNYYPGWKAYVNGKPAGIYRANYTLRAVKIPAGENRVEFIYKPFSFTIGLILSVSAGFIILFVFLIELNRKLFLRAIK